MPIDALTELADNINCIKVDSFEIQDSKQPESVMWSSTCSSTCSSSCCSS